MKLYNNNKTNYVYEQAGASRYGKWVIHKDCFSSFVNIQFEDTEFSCPIDTKKYLKTVYGDYMKLPPIEKRENRHSIIEVKF